VANSIDLATTVSRVDLYLELRCAIKVGPDKKFCRFRVYARNLVGRTEITRVDEVHSCLEKIREGIEEWSRENMVAKIRKLKEQIANARGGGAGQAGGSEEPAAKRVKVETEVALPEGADEEREEGEEPKIQNGKLPDQTMTIKVSGRETRRQIRPSRGRKCGFPPHRIFVSKSRLRKR